jgi:hypothetical protein
MFPDLYLSEPTRTYCAVIVLEGKYMLLIEHAFLLAEYPRPDVLPSVANMTAENPEGTVKIGQQVATTRLSQERPPATTAASGSFNTISRRVDNFRVTTPNEEESDSYEENEEEEDVKEMAAESTAKPQIVGESMNFYDKTSGLWVMLSAHDDLALSQPGCKLHQQEGKHRPETAPIPWSIMEESRNKCLEWLEKKHDQADL